MSRLPNRSPEVRSAISAKLTFRMFVEVAQMLTKRAIRWEYALIYVRRMPSKIERIPFSGLTHIRPRQFPSMFHQPQNAVIFFLEINDLLRCRAMPIDWFAYQSQWTAWWTAAMDWIVNRNPAFCAHLQQSGPKKSSWLKEMFWFVSTVCVYHGKSYVQCSPTSIHSSGRFTWCITSNGKFSILQNVCRCGVFPTFLSFSSSFSVDSLLVRVRELEFFYLTAFVWRLLCCVFNGRMQSRGIIMHIQFLVYSNRNRY